MTPTKLNQEERFDSATRSSPSISLPSTSTSTTLQTTTTATQSKETQTILNNQNQQYKKIVSSLIPVQNQQNSITRWKYLARFRFNFIKSGFN